jgi:hypothetical protein
VTGVDAVEDDVVEEGVDDVVDGLDDEDDSDFFGRRCLPSRVPMNKMTVEVVVDDVDVVRDSVVWRGQCRVKEVVPTVLGNANAVAILSAPHMAIDKEIMVPTVEIRRRPPHRPNILMISEMPDCFFPTLVGWV